MTTLTTALTFRNEAGLDVPALLSYDENDALAITIIFLDEAMNVEWVFGRDLFLEAFTQGSAGMGDGVISSCGDALLSLFHRLPGGHYCTFRADR